MSAIEENIKKVKSEIPSNVKLIAVSKTRNIEEMKDAYNCGIKDFGENKVQEFLKKVDNFGDDVNWHLIGHLQRNKVKYIVGKVDLIHSLDSVRLLNEIEKRYKEQGICANVLIQINIGEEESKTGLRLDDLDELLSACKQCKFVKVKGLMAIIPQGDEDSCRMYFKKMKKIYDEVKSIPYFSTSIEYLSLGMTNDYKIAVEEGSNMVRIGQGIFGKRNYNKDK